MTVIQKTADLTKIINETVKELQVTQAELDTQVSTAQGYANTAVTHRTTAEGYRDTTATHASTAATNLATVQGNVTFDGIDAILAEKAVTAVDVFVYDTSLDSDGGAWRKRCQHTSWYNEPLNTATRGSRREFPAVAVIVAEATKVTIYDGDDPSLPMWRVLLRDTVSTDVTRSWWRSSSVITAQAVSALNGKISIGLGSAESANCGLALADFVADELSHYSSAPNISNRGLPIVATGSDIALPINFGVSIVSFIVNDVAMTVLPDAPIDPATGLPVPTIAVATAGGVSVIKGDGTVVDIPTSGTATNWVGFNDRHQLASDGNYDDRWVLREIPPADVANLETGDATFVARPYRQYGQSADYQRQVNFGDTYASDLGNIKNGLLLEYGAGSALGRTSIVAMLTSTYNTGWMNGSIKGAFLSSTDTASLVGSGELVTNGDFGTGDLTGWTDSSVGTGTATVNGSNQLELYRLDVNNRGRIAQDITFVSGSSYVVTFTKIDSSASIQCKVGNSDPDVATNLGQVQAAGQYSFTFSSTRYLHFLNVSNGTTAIIDNISVKLADADRSVNNKGLIVNGTITRSPVADGAELVGYSGFSAANYLEQPYNSALDFGTGDFCVMGWLKLNSTSGGGYWLSHVGTNGSGNRDGWELFGVNGAGNTGSVRFRRWNDGVLQDIGVGITWPALNQWFYLVATRTAGGVLTAYLNGTSLGAQSGIGAQFDVSGAHDRVMRVGTNFDAGSPSRADMALWRITTTVPTADQIRRIYEDERKLFQLGAKCTLYGASDAVTALAHDPKTNLLHVGTSQGRSVFDGLVRVANTTTPVGAAISAVNGLIVEE